MKKLTVFFCLLLTAGSILLIAFSPFNRPFGGDSVEIYLDKQLVLRQYLHEDESIKTINLTAADQHKNLKVFFNHCGEVGKSRSITLKNGEEKPLRVFRFADGDGKWMVVPVSKIPVNGAAKMNKDIKLVYQAKELPKGRTLAVIHHSESSNRVRP